MGKFYGFARIVLNGVLPIIWRIRFENKAGLTMGGPYIVSCNHIFWPDPLIIAYKCKREIHFLGKKELFRKKIVAGLFKLLGAIPITRGTSDISAIKTVLRTLKNGGVMGIFPEGTRTGGEYYNPMQEGAAFFALRTGCPILPCGIAGSIKFRGKLQLCIGEPIYPEIEEDKKPDNDDIQALTTRLGEEIIKLSERAKSML